MSQTSKTLRQRRASARTRRAVYRAIEQADTPSMRDELIILGQRSGLL